MGSTRDKAHDGCLVIIESNTGLYHSGEPR